jgi:hypothetical protein
MYDLGTVMGKSRLYVAGFLLVFLIGFSSFAEPIVPFVSAANDQGLDWSIEIGSIFNYTFRCTELITSAIPIGEYELYFNITSLPVLEDNITSVDDFRLVSQYNYDMFFQNGTYEWSGLYPFVILPTGNWSLMQTLWNNSSYYSDTMTWVNTTTDWGFIGRHEGLINDLTSKYWYIFSKADGHLLLYFVGFYLDDVQDDYVELRLDSYSSYPDLIEPITTTNPTTPTSTTTNQTGPEVIMALAITGSLVVLLVLVVVYYRKSRV